MSEVTNLEKIRRLPWQVVGNAFNIAYCLTTFFGSVFILFLSEIGLDKARIGFLLSLLPFCGLTAIFTAPFIERFGFKRIFLWFYGLRNFFTIFLIFTPLILSKFGTEAAFFWVGGVVLLFALCRAIAETAIFPWGKEIVPDSMRGKFSAINTIVSMLVSILVVAVAGYVIGHSANLDRFIILIIFGIVGGMLTLWCFSFVPGGAPVTDKKKNTACLSEMFRSVLDRNYFRFMSGLIILSIGISALASFMPLYMKDNIGLTPGLVVWLDIGNFIGGLLTCFVWGWAADRFGSKPIMLTGATMFIFYPVLAFLTPAGSSFSFPMAMAATFVMGSANIAWAIGFSRYLFVTAVPSQKMTSYMAVFYAGAGLAGGLGPLLGGALLKMCNGFKGEFLFLRFDAYTVLFAVGIALLAAGIFCLEKVRADGAIPMLRFVGMFLQGNPFAAAGSLVRYHYWAKDEEARVSITEQMGYANNPFSDNELIAALNDPSFNVRYEAIVAIAHSRPDPALVDALILVLGGNEPDLSVHAAWALGRLGEKHAAIALRETLESEHPLLRARSARALATLGDTHSIERLLHHFRTETNPGLRIAYAQGLGKMRAAVAIDEMLEFFATLNDRILRAEMALAIGRIVGNEKEYISLLREFEHDKNTAAAQAMLTMEKEFSPLSENGESLAKTVRHCSKAFANGDFENGIPLLKNLIAALPTDTLKKPLAAILADCARRLEQFGAARNEYLLLSVHAINTAIKKSSPESSPL